MEKNYLLEAYRSDKTHERVLSPGSVALFSRHVAAFLEATRLDDKGERVGYPIDADGIRAFLMSLEDNGPVTVKSKLSALKSFAEWLFSKSLLSELEKGRIKGIKGPKVPKRLPMVFTQEEVTSLLEAPTPPAPQSGMSQRVFQARELRDLALAEAFYASGLRVAELCSLDLDSRVPLKPDLIGLRVIGKGNKERMGYAGKKAIAALDAWVAEREQLCQNQPLHPRALFVGIRGERLSPSEARRIVKRRGQLVGLRRVHPHALRHSFATHLNQQKAPLPLIQKLMGHERLASTEIYISVLPPEVAEGYQEYHPRA